MPSATRPETAKVELSRDHESPRRRHETRVLATRDQPSAFETDKAGPDLPGRHAAGLADHGCRGLGSVAEEGEDGGIRG